MKPLSEVAPHLLVIQIPIQAVCVQMTWSTHKTANPELFMKFVVCFNLFKSFFRTKSSDKLRQGKYVNCQASWFSAKNHFDYQIKTINKFHFEIFEKFHPTHLIISFHKKGYFTSLDLFGTQDLCNVVKTNIVKSIS